MDYRQFIEYCGYTQDLNPEWRRGQTHFNALYKLNPGLADYIRGTAIDPFYRDDAIQSFLVMVWGYATAFGSVKDERPSSNL
jgi:hypothetical protein